MDNKAYLQSIAVVETPPQKTHLDKKLALIIKIAIISTFIIIIAVIISTAVNNLAKKPKNLIIYLRDSSSNLISTIDKFNPSLKSPGIRKLNASLKTTLIGLNSTSTTYLGSLKKDPKDKDATAANITKSINANFKTVHNTLDDAILNAHLDTSYQEQILYQISLITSRFRELPEYQKSIPANIYKSLLDHKTNLEAVQSDISNFFDPSV